MTSGLTFAEELRQLHEPDFHKVRKLSESRLRKKNLLYEGFKINESLKIELQHGTKILDTEDELDGYAYLYWNKHREKFNAVYELIPHQVFSGLFDIIDWGCGSGVGLVVLHDVIKRIVGIHGLQRLRQAVLVEPSAVALTRAKQTIEILFPNTQVLTLHKRFEEFTENDFSSLLGVPRLHLFSNVLDLPLFKSGEFCDVFTRRVKRTAFQRDEYIVCVSPSVSTDLMKRFNYFLNLLEDGDRWTQEILVEKEITAAATTMVLKIVHVQNRRIMELCKDKYYTPDLFAQSIQKLDKQIFYDMVAVDDAEGVRAFIIHGVDVLAPDETGWPAILIAAKYGSINALRILIEAGGDVNAHNAAGFTALHLAAKYGELGVAELLLNNGAQIDCPAGKSRQTPLLSATRSDHLELVKLLLERGADINACDAYNQTALYIAAAGDFPATAELLLRHKANPDKIADTGLTPRSVAEVNGNKELSILFF